ncbi:SDR family oxidoreductase [Aminobacter aganoensis]
MTGATGQVGGAIVRLLAARTDLDVVLAVRSPEKAAHFGLPVVEMDYDRPETLLPALQGVDVAFLMTGYTIDMLRQSKSFIDDARKAGVKHVVHLGACGPDDTRVPHWGWHQFVERYIEWAGFSFTHLRPEAFMQNLIGYQGDRAASNGVLSSHFADARLSWVDCEDVAAVAVECLARPDRHNGQVYRLGYDAKTHADIAGILTEELGQPFRYVPRPPEEVLESITNGLEPAYMRSIYEHFVMHGRKEIPGADEVFDNFENITGRKPVTIRDFVRKHEAKFRYRHP